MIYLGLDLSTVSTGYAIFEDDKLKESGKIVPQESLDRIERIVYTVNQIRKVISNYAPNQIVVEGTYYGGNYETTVALNWLAGAVIYMCQTHEKKDCHGLSSKDYVVFAKPSSARKYFGLLPKTTKRLIVEAVNKKFNKEFLVKDNDECDAIVMGYYGYILDHKPDEMFKKEAQKFYKTKVRGMKTPSIKGLKK